MDKPKNYPSQDEAQLIIDTLEALESIYTGSTSNTNTNREIQKFRTIVESEFEHVFNHPDCSPWTVTIKRGRVRRVLKWRKGW